MGKKRVIAKSAAEARERSQEDLLRKGAKLAKLKLESARIYITSSYNNTIIALTDPQGRVLVWASAGRMGFEGTRKGTPFAASKVADFVAAAAKPAGIDSFEVYVRGIGSGREAALRSLAAKGLNIVAVRDVTPMPHNGPRPPKVRRA